MSRRLAHCIVATLAACLVVTGCSLLVDTSHLDDPTPATTGDGGASAKDGTTAGDGGLVPDGDGSSGSSEGGTSDFCASHPEATFCEDFSTANVDEHTVMKIEQNGGSAAGTLDTAVFRSPPGALHVRVKGVEQTGEVPEPNVILMKHLVGPIAGFACDLALRGTTMEGDFAIMRISFADATSLWLGGSSFASYFADRTENFPVGSLLSAPPQWRHLRMGIEAKAQSAGAHAGRHRVWLEQLEPPKLIAENFVPRDQPADSVDIEFGALGYDPRDVDLHLDDVMCTVVPP